MPSPAPSGLSFSFSRSSGAARAPWEAQEASPGGGAGALDLGRSRRAVVPEHALQFRPRRRERSARAFGDGQRPVDQRCRHGRVRGRLRQRRPGTLHRRRHGDGLQNINPSFSNDPNRVFGDAVEINNNEPGCSRWTAFRKPATPSTLLRTWDASTNPTDPFQIYCDGGLPGDRTTPLTRSRLTPRSTTTTMSSTRRSITARQPPIGTFSTSPRPCAAEQRSPHCGRRRPCGP